jgi:arsenate reductase (thioredoxin)
MAFMLMSQLNQRHRRAPCEFLGGHLSIARTILFVCLHGSAKSVIAVAHVERLARERRLDLRTMSRGLEPDESLPPHVVAGLRADGLERPVAAPRPVDREAVASADYVISFGCDLAPFAGNDAVIRWDDVPHVSDGYDRARTAIVERVERLLDAFIERSAPPGSS